MSTSLDVHDMSHFSGCDLGDQLREAQLLHATAHGDREAFTALCRSLEGLIYSTAQKVLNNAEDAKDVTQDVLLQIWRKADVYRPALGKPKTWVTTMARNKAIDRLRHYQRRAAARTRMEEETVEDVLQFEDASDIALAEERHRIVRKAVMELPKEQREAIFMAFYSGLTQTEIAGQTSMPLGTVKSRIRYGIRKLQGAIEGRL